MKFLDKIEEVYQFLEDNKAYAYSVDDLAKALSYPKKEKRRRKYVRQEIKKALRILAQAGFVEKKNIKLSDKDEDGRLFIAHYIFKKKGSAVRAYKLFELNRWEQWRSISSEDIDRMLRDKGLPTNGGMPSESQSDLN